MRARTNGGCAAVRTARAGAVLLCGVLGGAPAAAQAAGVAEGVWAAERHLGPAVAGELILLRDADAAGGWRARIAGFEGPAERVGDTLRFSLPGGRGGFRTRLDGGSPAAPHWIQPAHPELGLPPYATPVRLHPLADGVWRGEVRPLAQSVSLYLSVAPQADGTPGAILRNPEGWIASAAYALRQEGARVTLVSADGSQPPIEGSLDPTGTRLTLRVPPLWEPFVFTRRGRDQAPGFYARVAADAGSDGIRAPLPLGDGWSTASLARAGMRADSLLAMLRRLRGLDLAARGEPKVESVLIARGGRLVLEEYFFGYGADRLHDTRSVGKTFASVLVGRALQRGFALDVRRPVLDLLAQYRDVAGGDPRKRAITLEHLMTMTSGLACDENDAASPGGEGRMQAQSAEPDWYRFTLALPMAAAPGERPMYCSAGAHLVGAVLRGATGEWLPESFGELAARLDIGHYALNLTPTGEMYLGGGAYLRPRDLLKFGQLYLSGGTWNGRRVVGEAWVRASTTAHPEINPGHRDGYHWHLNEIRAGGRTYRQYEANGNGGQLVMVLPELDLVVGFTAGSYNQYGAWRRLRDEFLARYVIPAVADAGR